MYMKLKSYDIILLENTGRNITKLTENINFCLVC